MGIMDISLHNKKEKVSVDIFSILLNHTFWFSLSFLFIFIFCLLKKEDFYFSMQIC